MIKCGRWSGSSLLEEDLVGRVVVILTERCTQIHTVNATGHNLHRLAMMTRPKHYKEGTKMEK